MAFAIKATKTSSKVSLARPVRLIRAWVALERILNRLFAGGLSILLALPQKEGPKPSALLPAAPSSD